MALETGNDGLAEGGWILPLVPQGHIAPQGNFHQRSFDQKPLGAGLLSLEARFAALLQNDLIVLG
jgi:hypothetical protein